jgi:hypothetical protein
MMTLRMRALLSGQQHFISGMGHSDPKQGHSQGGGHLREATNTKQSIWAAGLLNTEAHVFVSCQKCDMHMRLVLRACYQPMLQSVHLMNISHYQPLFGFLSQQTPVMSLISTALMLVEGASWPQACL